MAAIMYIAYITSVYYIYFSLHCTATGNLLVYIVIFIETGFKLGPDIREK